LGLARQQQRIIGRRLSSKAYREDLGVGRRVDLENLLDAASWVVQRVQQLG
jgi:hypothetical protein